MRIAVVGGGITGIAAALRLVELAPASQVTLFEASRALGGVLQTTRDNGFLIEHASDSFITNVPWAVDLVRRHGLQDQLIPTNEQHRRAFVVKDGELAPVPEGFALMAPSRLSSVMNSPLLSPAGKLRLMSEYLLPPRQSDEDESLAAFARRRLGREVYERIVQPLVGGIYTADPEKLSIAATLPRFVEMEREHGGLIRGAQHAGQTARQQDQQSSGARYGMFVAPREGMANWVASLAANLPDGTLRMRSEVQEVRQTGSGWALTFGKGLPRETFDKIILTTPAPIAAKLLVRADASLAELLEGIPYAGAAVVSLGVRREQIKHPLDGFGFVVPAIENRKILAASFSSVKFPGRAPECCELIRVFVGGALQPEVMENNDSDLIELVRGELADLIGLSGDPLVAQVNRWHGSMPQYHLGHLDRIAQIESRVAALPGLELAGNAFHGVGIPHCIHSGETAAQRTVGYASSLPT